MHSLFEDELPSEKTSSEGQPFESSSCSFCLSLLEKENLESFLGLESSNAVASDRGLLGMKLLYSEVEDLEIFGFSSEDSFFTKPCVGVDVPVTGEDARIGKLVETRDNGGGLLPQAAGPGWSTAKDGHSLGGDERKELSKTTAKGEPKLMQVIGRLCLISSLGQMYLCSQCQLVI